MKMCKTPEEARRSMAKCHYWNGRKSLSPDTPLSVKIRQEIYCAAYDFFAPVRWLWRIAKHAVR